MKMLEIDKIWPDLAGNLIILIRSGWKSVKPGPIWLEICQIWLKHYQI